jgi:general secretion pathway protein L
MNRTQLTTAGPHVLDLCRDFLRWWGSELTGLLPASLGVGARAPGSSLLIRCDGGELYWVARRGERCSAPRPLPSAGADPAVRRALMSELGSSIDEPDRAVLVLPESRVLRLEVQLPSAAVENLRGVLGFEMDKHTPFRADQVYYDFRLSGEPVAEHVSVELLVVPRHTLDPLVERIAALGIGLTRIVADSVEQSGVPGADGMNLLPPERRARSPRSAGLVNRVLGGIAAALAVTVAAVPLVRLHVAEKTLAAEVASARARAAEVAGLREELSARIAETEAVMRRKQNEPPVIEVLGELAAILPDHTWLRSLELQGGTLQIRGESGAASELIGLIEGSSLFEAVSFVSPVTRSPGSNQESFEIATKVASRQ